MEQTYPNNRNLSGDISLVVAKGLELYGEGLVDDFQPQEGVSAVRSWNTKFGLLAGLFWVDPFGMSPVDLTLEYAFTNQFAYTHRELSVTYDDRGLPLGHRIGTDAESVAVRLFYRQAARLTHSLFVERRVDGEGGLRLPRGITPGNAVDKWEYLSGDRRGLVTTEYAGRWISAHGAFVSARVGYQWGTHVNERSLDDPFYASFCVGLLPGR
ncbi:MAG: hypothetical protein O3A46_17650, partial [Candidatus Poribacteria bacterium]|nr:hypothetical protein [Candidatus Poribacteria bacterium]